MATAALSVVSATNNGTVTFLNGVWLIACEPHVRTKLRRVFPQVSQRAGEVIKLSSSDENCRDLLWFMERYPMEVKPAKALRSMKSSAIAHVDAEATVAQLLASYVLPTKFELAEPARDYQNMAATLAIIKSGLLVADDIGVGKTCTGICPVVVPGNLPAMVVVEPHLIKQWAEQLARFVPHLKVHILKTGTPYELRKLIKRKGKQSKRSGENLVDDLFGAPPVEDEREPFPDIILCNYHKLNGWAETLAGVIRYIVFDEVQSLRHMDSAKYDAAKLLSSKAILRVGLSATPFYNYGSEMYSVIQILRPGVLGTHEEFLREWCDHSGLIKEPRAFGAYLRREGIMVRRTRADVKRELPPFQGIPYSISSDKEALDKIQGSAVELAKIILNGGGGKRGAAFHASEEFSNLMRQATGIAKAPHAAEFARLLLASEKKIVIFAWHRSVYDILMSTLAEFKPRMYTGSESQTQKAASKAAFLDPESDCRVLLISLRAGSGLDGLQHVCKVGVFAELDYSPGVHEQCAGRYFRDGQDEPSLAYYLLAEDGSDPVIAEILGIKIGQIQGVRDPNAELIEEMQVDSGGVRKLASAYLESLGLHKSTAEAAAIA